MPNPAYGDPFAIMVAGIVLLTILLVTRFFRGFYANLGVLMGISVAQRSRAHTREKSQVSRTSRKGIV